MSFFREFFDWNCPKCYKPESRFCDWLIIITLTLASMTAIVDLLSSALLLSELQGYFAIDDTKTTWLAKSFFFMAAIAPLYATYMANIYGYKRMLFIGIFLFWIGAILSGIATHYKEMLFYRTLAGTGGGIVFAVCLVYIPRILPEQIRSRALTFYSNTFFGLGITIGLLLGGYVGQAYHWRTAFLLNLYAAPILTLLMLFLLPETEKLKKTPFDYFSLITLALCLFTLLMIVIDVKAPWNTLGWHAPHLHLCGVVSIVSFLLFLWASLTKEHPLINLHLFSHLSFSIGCLGMLIIGFMVFGVTLASMDIFEKIYLYQRWTVGGFVSTLGLIYFSFGILTTLLANHIKPRVFILIGLSLIIISCFMNQQITIQSTLFEIGALQTMRSIGIGLVLGPFTVLALSTITPEEMPKATAFIGFLRFMAATFGSSIITLIIEIHKPYHSLRFGEQVNIYSARFEQYFTEYKRHLIENVSSSPLDAFKQARLLIIEYIQGQAVIASLNDALFIFGWTSFGLMIIIGGMMFIRIWREKKLTV